MMLINATHLDRKSGEAHHNLSLDSTLVIPAPVYRGPRQMLISRRERTNGTDKIQTAARSHTTL
jgi:hypothetical protein